MKVPLLHFTDLQTKEALKWQNYFLSELNTLQYVKAKRALLRKSRQQKIASIEEMKKITYFCSPHIYYKKDLVWLVFKIKCSFYIQLSLGLSCQSYFCWEKKKLLPTCIFNQAANKVTTKSVEEKRRKVLQSHWSFILFSFFKVLLSFDGLFIYWPK